MTPFDKREIRAIKRGEFRIIAVVVILAYVTFLIGLFTGGGR